MEKVIFRQETIHEGRAGVASLTVKFLTKSEMDLGPMKPNWADNRVSPKTIAELTATSKARSLTYTEPFTQTQHVINFDELGVTDFANTYILFSSSFDIGGNLNSPPPERRFER